MVRLRTMQLSVLNIKIHPHTPDRYTQMFQFAFSKRIIQSIRGTDSGMLGSLRDDQSKERGVIYGYIYKFLNINPNEKWLDLRNFKTIDPQKTGKYPVPENLKPNLKQIGYVFYPAKHRLFFNSTSIAPGSILTLFKKIFSVTEVKKEYGKVDINIEATNEAIQKIIAIPQITKLSIHFTRPNNDDITGLEKNVRDRIEQQNIKNFKQEASTNDKEGIKPDNETKALMNVARSNGSVVAIGYDGEKRVEHSTKDHPIKERTKYNPNYETETTTMIDFSIQLIKKLFG